MTKNFWLEVCLSVLLVSALGCGVKEERRQTTTDSTTSEQIDGERLRYEGDAERQLARWGARIDSMKASLDAKSDAAKAEMKQEIENLEAKRQEAANKLNDLKTAGAERWTGAKRGVADVLDSLDRRFDSLRQRLRDERG